MGRKKVSLIPHMRDKITSLGVQILAQIPKKSQIHKRIFTTIIIRNTWFSPTRSYLHFPVVVFEDNHRQHHHHQLPLIIFNRPGVAGAVL